MGTEIESMCLQPRNDKDYQQPPEAGKMQGRIDHFCNPIIYKPKPKVEVAEDKAKANSEHNGPVDGQSGTETKPDTTKDSTQHTKSSGEMEVD